jgi:hypothetical protein
MNTTDVEIAAVEQTTVEKTTMAMRELRELQLVAAGGGGCGETILV